MGKLASFLIIIAVTLYAVWPWIRRLRGLTGMPSRNTDMTLLDARAYGYRSEEVREYFVALGAEGRRWYLRRQLPRDAVFAIFYGPILATIALTFGRIMDSGGYRSLAWLAVLAGCLWVVAALTDLAEGWLIRGLLVRWPLLDDRSVSRASLATRIKFALLFAAGLPTFGLGLTAMAFWLKGA